MLVPHLKNRHSVSLRKLFPSASFVGCADIHVSSVSDNSKDIGSNFLFAAIPGTKANGTQFIQEAIANGATSLLCDQPQPHIAIPQCVVPHVRAAFARLCHALYGNPTQRLKTIGITGTNGKTTTSYLVRSILQAAGFRTGLLGTIEYHDGMTGDCSDLTTPDPPVLAEWLHKMVEQGTTHAVFEMSSHAMHQDRTAGVELDAAILTNITHDHLDYHADFEDYKQSKYRILHHCKRHAAVILNQSDVHVRSIEPLCPKHLAVATYGEAGSVVRATRIEPSLTETRFLLHLENETIPVQTQLIGRHNIENCLAAAGACHQMGIGPAVIAQGIEQLERVPGRLEAIDLGQEYNIFVDYAHTDDALKRCLKTLWELTENRLICVFGAGGDRDRSKRPLLAAATTEADIAIVTSDNPRTEDPFQIINDILNGFSETNAKVIVEPHREKAIHLAMDIAKAGDTLLIAGKGHETYQIIGTARYEFDDKKVVRAKLAQVPIRLPA
jgi:UDP-N-acetylmuramoyl-L-alanyl-D-glutamate--2,6-diaminopimelate ligase